MATISDLIIAGGAAFVAGGVNAIAGGGTLISFPALVALGVPALRANVTNTVALCPGYFGGAVAQREAVEENRVRLRKMVPVVAVGGLLGSVLLVLTSEDAFKQIVPYLILLACALLGFQDMIKRMVFGHQHVVPPGATPVSLLVGVFLAAVYGGYFGAGLGIMLLAVLGLLLDGELPKLNALKQVLALVINVLAATFFVFSGKVEWAFAAVMAPMSLVGGHVGGTVASKMNATVMRSVVIAFGVAVSGKMLLT